MDDPSSSITWIGPIHGLSSLFSVSNKLKPLIFIVGILFPGFDVR